MNRNSRSSEAMLISLASRITGRGELSTDSKLYTLSELEPVTGAGRHDPDAEDFVVTDVAHSRLGRSRETSRKILRVGWELEVYRPVEKSADINYLHRFHENNCRVIQDDTISVDADNELLAASKNRVLRVLCAAIPVPPCIHTQMVAINQLRVARSSGAQDIITQALLQAVELEWGCEHNLRSAEVLPEEFSLTEPALIGLVLEAVRPVLIAKSSEHDDKSVPRSGFWYPRFYLIQLKHRNPLLVRKCLQNLGHSRKLTEIT